MVVVYKRTNKLTKALHKPFKIKRTNNSFLCALTSKIPAIMNFQLDSYFYHTAICEKPPQSKPAPFFLTAKTMKWKKNNFHGTALTHISI